MKQNFWYINRPNISGPKKMKTKRNLSLFSGTRKFLTCVDLCDLILSDFGSWVQDIYPISKIF